MTGRMMEATYNDQAYSIPEIWVMGFCRGERTVLDAIAWWAYQCELAELETN